MNDQTQIKPRCSTCGQRVIVAAEDGLCMDCTPNETIKHVLKSIGRTAAHLSRQARIDKRGVESSRWLVGLHEGRQLAYRVILRVVADELRSMRSAGISA